MSEGRIEDVRRDRDETESNGPSGDPSPSNAKGPATLPAAGDRRRVRGVIREGRERLGAGDDGANVRGQEIQNAVRLRSCKDGRRD